MTGFRDRLTFDASAGTWADQTRRYMLIRPDALMGIFRRLPSDARMEALAALSASIFEQGTDSARAYMAMGGEGDALLTVIAETAPELGWGRWQFTRSDDTLVLIVENSPFAAGFGPSEHPVCAAIAGMVSAVSTLVFGRPMQATESACAAMGAPHCRFVAEAIDGPSTGDSA